MTSKLIPIVVSGTRDFILSSPSITTVVEDKIHSHLLSIVGIFRNIPDTQFILFCGAAEGFDERCAFIAKDLEIKIRFYIPNPNYSKYYWMNNSKTGYNRINIFNYMIGTDSETILVSSKLYVNGIHSNLIRNEKMCRDAANGYGIVYNPSGKSKGTIHCHKEMLKYNIKVAEWNTNDFYYKSDIDYNPFRPNNVRSRK